MIVRDEEKFLAQCLDSAKDFADEIIIVDTGSKDKTVEIAKKYTDKIYFFEWCDDFSKARNESIRHAAKDWILFLDADEVIEKEDFAKIKQAIKSDVKAFRLNIVNITGSGDKVFGLVRLFRNNEGFYFRNRIHELVDDSITEKGFEIKELDARIMHYGLLNRDESAIKNKIKMYISLVLKQAEDTPDNPRYAHQAGMAYMQLNEFELALKYLKQAAELNPHYKLIYSDIAKVYLKKGMVKEAVESYKKSADLNPDNPSPLNNLAVLYGINGETGKAKEILSELVRRFPDNEAVKVNYKRLMNS
jgi:glycosyltransferase involved in cell wall biosynthesis